MVKSKIHIRRQRAFHRDRAQLQRHFHPDAVRQRGVHRHRKALPGAVQRLPANALPAAAVKVVPGKRMANRRKMHPDLAYAMAEISDLGLSKILSQYANLLIPFVSMGMSNAIIRFGLDKGNSEKQVFTNSEKQVFTNGLLTILGGFGILVLCWPVTQFLPDMAQYGLLIYIYVLMSCLRTLCTQFVRSRQWNKLVAVDGVLCTVATMAFLRAVSGGLQVGRQRLPAGSNTQLYQ